MVHIFTQCGYKLALDSASGSVHLLNGVSYDILSILTQNGEDREDMPESIGEDILAALSEKYDGEKLREAYSELYELYEAGMLFSSDVVIPPPVYRAENPIKSMCLHISHDCNMRCKYCFAGKGDYGRKRELMSYECGCAAIDFLLKRSGGIKNLELDFFGGEPLMNFDVVKRLVKYGREKEAPLGKHIRFTMTTNGTLLDDESIDFLNENMSNIVLSVDGRREVNDLMRPAENGDGTYDVIIPAYKKLVSKRKGDWYVRGTFTAKNLDFVNDVMALADEGFENISVEPVVLDERDELAIKHEHLPQIFAEYDKLSDIMIRLRREGRGFTFFHFMIDLDAGPCVYKRTKGCGSGCEYIAVTPDGSVYPCHQFAETEPFRMGSVYGGELRGDIAKEFCENNIITNKECSKCFAKYFCGGGCAANNHKYCGDIRKPYEIGCILERKRVECAIAVETARILDEQSEAVE